MMSRRKLMEASMAGAGSMVLGRNAWGENAKISAKAAGFHMPLGSEPHLRTFMQWPAVKSIYGSQEDIDAVREKIALIANTIARFEPVVLLTRPEQMENTKEYIKVGVELWPLEVQDLWCRDTGPTFVVNAKGELAVSELGFNGWGDKQEHADDARVARRVATKLGLHQQMKYLISLLCCSIFKK